MKYSITFSEKDYDAITGRLLGGETERAAYILCRPSLTDNEIRLIARKIIFVEEADIESASATHIEIPSRSFTKALKAADDRKECFLFAHSHPAGRPDFSEQDDREEKELFRTAYTRISTIGAHGSIVFSPRESPSARMWLADGTSVPADVVRVIGNRFRFYINGGPAASTEFFDRQIRAFGSEVQNLLKSLRIGVVGLGGTGSVVAEQLVRLGVGNLLLIDGQSFEKTNVNRVYGSRSIDEGIKKVKIAERLAADIGLGTEIQIIDRPISAESAARSLRDCDIIFGCTDDEFGRSILTRIAIYYLIPIFDMGVKIDSENEVIKAVEGRVTTLVPGAACLFCRERINPDRILSESIQETDPDEATARRQEGYVPGLAETAPSVIPFTTAVAASAISELLHRLTGYLGDDRPSTEVIHQFHESKIRTNSTGPKSDCWCNDPTYIGRADAVPFLDTTWGIS
ncbi:MAG: ThiF family adenylyltransferase [Patescibacteria group bacterium]|nr:ThiF family adenylyltransferase [Patescibacteria group bacterium]